jgi:hypothetical protein
MPTIGNGGGLSRLSICFVFLVVTVSSIYTKNRRTEKTATPVSSGINQNIC